MLQLPPISSPSSSRAVDAASSSAEGESTDFGGFLDQVTDKPLPPKLRAELLAQVDEGVPVSDVLASLVDRLDEETDLTLAPGMLPVLQVLLPDSTPLDLSALRVALGRGVANTNQPPGGGFPVAADNAAGEDDALSDADNSPDNTLISNLVGKQKTLEPGRVAALDMLANTGASVTTTQATPLRGLEMSGLSALLPQTADLDEAKALVIPQKVGDAQWGQALAQRIVWMVGQDKQVAELRLNPANLGPLEVRLTLHQDQASVSLLASNGAVRDALEQALPRLRDLFSQQDLQLTQVDVGHRQASQDGRTEGQGAEGRSAGASVQNQGDAEGHGDSTERATNVSVAVSQGLIDTYV